MEAAYRLNASAPLSAAVEALRITEAPSLSSGSAFCTVKSVPRTLTPKISSNRSSVISSSGTSEAVAALAKTTSSPRPRARTAS